MRYLLIAILLFSFTAEAFANAKVQLEKVNNPTQYKFKKELRKKNISLEKLSSYKYKYLIRYLKESSDDYTTSDINDIIDLLSKDLSYSKLFELDYYNNYETSITSKELRAIVNACKNLTDEQIGTALGRNMHGDGNQGFMPGGPRR